MKTIVSGIGGESFATGSIIVTCNNERILQTVRNKMLLLPDFRNNHPCISPQILHSHKDILREGKQGESIEEFEI